MDLLAAVRQFADAHADANGVAATPIPGLSLIRAAFPGELQYAIARPLVALLLQGNKRVTMGEKTLDFGAGESLLIAADVPNVSQVTRASARAPYYSLVLELDPAIIERLVVDMEVAGEDGHEVVRVDRTEAEVADAALRLMRLLDRPAAARVLKAEALREMHYWLLAGRHGPAIRNLGVPGSGARRVSRAVALIRKQYAKPLRVERLAQTAGMSPSSFHEHFRAVTTLSPLQFQKQLRLIEARRMMLADGANASSAAYTVGYQSVPQFTREYARMFGAPPVRHVRQARVVESASHNAKVHP